MNGVRKYRNLIAECHRLDDQGLHTESIKLLTKALEQTSGVSELFFQRAEQYAELDKYSLALADYSEAIKLNPTVVDYYVSRGILYNQHGQPSEAIVDYKTAIKIDPNSPAPHQFLSLTYSLLDEVSEAAKHAKRAVKLDGEDALSYFCVATSHMDVRDYSSAIEALLIAVNLEADSANYWSALGRSYLKTKNMEESRRCYEKALELAPEAHFYIKLAKIMLHEGDPKGAIEKLSTAKKFELSDTEKILIDEYMKRAQATTLEKGETNGEIRESKSPRHREGKD